MWTFYYISPLISLTLGKIHIAPFYNNPLNDGMTCSPMDKLFLRKAGSVLLCSAICNTNSSCSSFFYNQEKKTCNGCLAAYDIRVEFGTDDGSRYYSDKTSTNLITSTTTEFTPNASVTTQVSTTEEMETAHTSTKETAHTSTIETAHTSTIETAHTSTIETTHAMTTETTHISTNETTPTTAIEAAHTSTIETAHTSTKETPQTSTLETAHTSTTETTHTSTHETPSISTTNMQTSTINPNDGWVLFQERFYLYVDLELVESEAVNYCKRAQPPSTVNTGGRIAIRVVVVETKELNDFVQQLIKANQVSDQKLVLLGIEFDETDLRVLNGHQLIAYANWYEEQPNITNGIVYIDQDGKWYRMSRENASPFICELVL